MPATNDAVVDPRVLMYGVLRLYNGIHDVIARVCFLIPVINTTIVVSGGETAFPGKGAPGRLSRSLNYWMIFTANLSSNNIAVFDATKDSLYTTCLELCCDTLSVT